MDYYAYNIDGDQLLRLLMTSAVHRLKARGYQGESAARFVDAIHSLFESTKKEIQSECINTLTIARANGGTPQDYAALSLAIFATAGVDIADRAIRERVSSN